MRIGRSLIYAVGLSLLWSQRVGALVREHEEGRPVRGNEFQRRHRSRRLGDERKKKCPEGSMMGSCAPSAAPSESPAPSAVPTASPSAPPSISDTPTDSPAPSNSPSESPSDRPSVSPSITPSSSPSISPTQVPSLSPTLSLPPSIAPSRMPSAFPSLSPTTSPSSPPSVYPSSGPSRLPSSSPVSVPSETPTSSSPPTVAPTKSPAPSGSPPPTLSPSGLPSSTPSVSPAPTETPRPTWDPAGVDTRSIGDETVSECRADIPSSAVSVEQQLATFDYHLNLEPDADLADIVDEIELWIHKKLLDEYVKCTFTSGPPFHVHTLNTKPEDEENTERSCTESEQVDGAVCHHINGGFTSTIVYLPVDGRRLANETISDRNVRDSFNASLTRIFGELEVPGVVSLGFVELTNDDTTDSRGIESGSSSNAGAIAGGVIGGIAGAVVIVAIGIFAVRRQQQKEREILGESLDDDELKGSRDGQEDEDDDIETVQVENVTDKVAVVNDDESFEQGFPDVGDTNREEDDPQDPTFVKTEDSAEDVTSQVPDESQVKSMQAAVEEELGPKAYESQQPRDYEVSDTVDL